MIHLRLLGPPRVERDGEAVRGPASQRHRVALLALLHGAGPRGMTRDRVLGYLWPESAEGRGRRLLSEALYVLRKNLGPEAVASEGDQLRLAAEGVRVDVAEFEAALAAGDAERAAALYAGPFLDGFFLDGAIELERWIERERGRLSDLHRRLLGELAEAAAERGDLPATAGWRRRAADADPLDSRLALELVRALAAAGDRAGALRHARAHRALLADELGIDPDARLAALEEELERPEEPEPLPAAPPAPAEPRPVPAAEGAASEPAPEPDAEPEPRPRPRPAGALPRPSKPRRWRRAAAAAASVLALATVLGLALGVPGRGAEAAPDAAEVAILPFDVQGDAELQYLRHGAAEILGLQIDQIGGMRPVSPRLVFPLAGEEPVDAAAADAVARRLGSRFYLTGEVVAAGPRVRVTASLFARGSRRPRATASVDGATDEVFALVDRLAVELLTRADRSPAGKMAAAARATTPSLPALRAFLQAERALRAGSRGAAVAALEEALREDSAFALAHYRLSVVAEAEIRPELAHEASDAAYRHRDRLAGRYRRLVEASHAWRAGEAVTAERLYSDLAAAYPDEVEAWSGLGEVLYHANPLRGRSLEESRAAWERVLALDPDHLAAMNHLVRIAAMRGEVELASRLASGVLRLDPGSDQAFEARSLARLAAGDEPPLPFPAVKPASLQFLVWLSAGMLEDPAAARRFAAGLSAPAQPREVRASGRVLEAYLEAARGRWRAAGARLDAAAELHPRDALVARALVSTLPWSPTPEAELRRTEEALLRWRADREPPEATNGVEEAVSDLAYPALRHYLLGRVAARRGDAAAAAAQAAALRRDAAEPEGVEAVLALGIESALRGEEGGAALYGGGSASPLRGISYQAANRSPVLSQAHERFLHARALERAGEPREALRWYASLAQGSRFDFVYLAPAHLRQAGILDALGQAEEAARHYDAFARLWADCDPELRPLVERARARSAALRAGAAPDARP